MMSISRFHRSPRARRGIATLEFAMSLPVLLALFVLIVWLGASVVGQSQVIVVARNNTWKERFNVAEGSGNPLVFAADAPIKRSAETTVDVSPIFATQAPPRANSAILAGSWDHRQLDLNSPPNWNLYAVVGGSAADLNIQNLLGNLTDFGSKIKNIVDGVIPVGGGDNLNSVGDIGSMLPL